LSQELNYRHGKLKLDLFSGISKDLSFSLGISADYLSQIQKFLDDINAAKNSLRQTSVYARFILENYNRKYFPTQGTKLSAKANLVLGGAIKNEIETQSEKKLDLNKSIQFEFSQIFKLSKNTTILWYNHAGVMQNSTADFINLFYLGRKLSYEPQFIPFTGLKYMQQPADGYGFSGLRLQMEPWEGKFISLDYNLGYFHSPEFIIEENEGQLIVPEVEGRMSGAGLEFGLSSTLGPVIFRSEFNIETKSFNFILQLGFEF
jgi:hypothetical protein